jgi:hypothetical protein
MTESSKTKPERSSRLLLAFGVLAALVGAGILGFLVGVSSAHTDREADVARAESFRQSLIRARISASRRAAAKGREAGLEAGRAAAEHAGKARGEDDGRSEAAAQQAAIAAAEAEAAAEVEAQERAENCGAPLFVEGYCPTDAEIEQENQAESEGGIP